MAEFMEGELVFVEGVGPGKFLSYKRKGGFLTGRWMAKVQLLQGEVVLVPTRTLKPWGERDKKENGAGTFAPRFQEPASRVRYPWDEEAKEEEEED